MKEGLGWLDRNSFLQKSAKYERNLFKPPLIPLLEKQGIDLAALTEELKSIQWASHSSGDNYSDWSPSFLIDYIINTHHTFVRQKTGEIPIYAAKVAKVHGERHPENVEIFKLFSSLSNELLEHLSDEEEAVFPLIKTVSEKKDRGAAISDAEMDELKHQLKLMIDDHERAGQIMVRIRELSNNFTPPADACKTYQVLYQNLAGFEEDLHKHVHLENNILFRKIERLVAA